jgi:hypothetical protein
VPGIIEDGNDNVLRLSARDFEEIFQVTKELHSLPAERLAEIGFGAGQGDELLAALRDIRMQVRDASTVEVRFADRGTGEAWHTLTTAIVLVFGERELFLRTGYGVDEVRDSMRLLALLLRQ